ncbi:unnamed protein product [Rhizoctonia solani]|uniref:Transmembrane protein n=1 Tax=Rhizoctonia solani TaxID=456999 RepID=A0A8H3HRA6_9AGAM|nr:unnamed protein product [Rhizoctonia solani]
MMPTVSFFLFAFLGFLSTIMAYPTGLNARQAMEDAPAPAACVVTCAQQVVPMVPSCVQVFSVCLQKQCMFYESDAGVSFINPYCTGDGMVHTVNGVVVTDLPPVPTGVVPTVSNLPLSMTAGPTTVIVTEFVTLSSTNTPTTTVATPTATPSSSSTDISTPTFFSATASASASTVIIESMNSSTALRSPAAISVYVIISIIIILLILAFTSRWRRNRQRDYIIPSHRRTRGKSFLIDESSFQRRSFHGAIDLTTKPAPVYNLTLKKETPLPAVPIPTKDSSDPAAGIALSYVPQFAIVHNSTRNYTALPGRSPSPDTSPEPEKSFVTQTFAAGRERAITNIRHSREGSRSPTSPASSISSLSSANGDMYAATTQSPLPAYAYMAPHRPAAPSPLRVQLGTKPVPNRVSTIQEEPRTPYGAQSVLGMPTSMTQPMSVLNSKVESAQRFRPTLASHVRNPGSTERMRQFTFPRARESLNETELQITISEALMDDVPVSRSQTPSGSMHRGAGGSVSSISKVQGKLQALVGGMRRDRD